MAVVMTGRECYHCKQWIEPGEAHDCWTTTEAALTEDLSEELRDAWQRLREAAVELGEQRIYASGSCIMFARDVCHFFVRPKRSYLELCLILPRAVKAPQVRRVEPKSKIKFANLVPIRHRDEVEPPITHWMREAYELQDVLKTKPKASNTKTKAKSKAARKPAARVMARKRQAVWRAK